MKTPVTIILPVHNGERKLRPVVYRILELAEIVHRKLRVVIVDDGSTDETYEQACELARMYPQVCVLRQPMQRGLGPALDQVRRKLSVEYVIVHDGASAIDVDELAALLREPNSPVSAADGVGDALDARGSRRFAPISALNSRLAEVHRGVSSLRWLRLEPPSASRRKRAESAHAEILPETALGGIPFGMGIPAPTT